MSAVPEKNWHMDKFHELYEIRRRNSQRLAKLLLPYFDVMTRPRQIISEGTPEFFRRESQSEFQVKVKQACLQIERIILCFQFPW